MTPSLFQAGRNCWRSSTAARATLLIDYASFYRALHDAFSRARHSIFIVGWDIDSRIRLLRGEEARQARLPSVISELLAAKARAQPALQIYLLRWDSSLAFFSKRELLLKEVWDQKTPANVQTCLDASIPMGGCQHQKVIVVDDELAFSGGMDITIGRWDTREHPVLSVAREDDDGLYGPLHDVQAMVSGPVVADFAELVRWRWERVAETLALPVRTTDWESPSPPPTWPRFATPLWRDMPCAIARTLPFIDDVRPVQEVRQMLLDLIGEARDLIYVENQFASRQEIAEAMNRRLKDCPGLRILIVSTYRPKGTFECEGYWASRIDFKRILEQGTAGQRAKLVYPSASDGEGNWDYKRIHAKVMAVDDRYLCVGSANLSNRSMALDTECDLVFSAQNPQQRRRLAGVRNDLLAEHCGRTAEQVGDMLAQPEALDKLIEPAAQYGWCLHEVSDEQFTDKSFQLLMRSFSDPEEPMVPALSLNGKRYYLPNPSRKQVMGLVALVLALALLIVGWLANQYLPAVDTEAARTFLEDSRDTWWALPAVCLVYLLGGITFFPVTVLSLAVAAIFGPLLGPIYGICGALMSAALLFGIGHGLGIRGLRRLGGPRIRMLDEKIRRSGIIGMAALRLLPIAPYSLVNLVAGISSVSLFQFMAGTFLGMFPPMVAKGLVGDSLARIVLDPTPLNITYLLGGVGLWVALVVFLQKLANRWQQRKFA